MIQSLEHGILLVPRFVLLFQIGVGCDPDLEWSGELVIVRAHRILADFRYRTTTVKRMTQITGNGKEKQGEAKERNNADFGRGSFTVQNWLITHFVDAKSAVGKGSLEYLSKNATRFLMSHLPAMLWHSLLMV